MLKNIKQAKAKIDELMKNHGVKEWKLFEDIPNLKFPTTSPDAHFLIIPSEKLDLTQMRLLKNAIADLFPEDLLEFYTPGQLEDLIDQGKLNQQIYQQIMASTATSADDTTKAEKKNQAEIKFFAEAIPPVQTNTSSQTIVTIDVKAFIPEDIATLVQRKLAMLDSYAEKKSFISECQKCLNCLDETPVHRM